jgi:hypothetical protein
MDILGERWEVGLALAHSIKDFGKVDSPIGTFKIILHQGLDLWVTFILPTCAPVMGVVPMEITFMYMEDKY